MGPFTFLWDPALLRFLNKEGKHVRPHKLLHKLAVGLGGDGFAEGSLLEGARAVFAPLDVRGVVANRSDEELDEGFGDERVHLLGRWKRTRSMRSLKPPSASK